MPVWATWKGPHTVRETFDGQRDVPNLIGRLSTSLRVQTLVATPRDPILRHFIAPQQRAFAPCKSAWSMHCPPVGTTTRWCRGRSPREDPQGGEGSDRRSLTSEGPRQVTALAARGGPSCHGSLDRRYLLGAPLCCYFASSRGVQKLRVGLRGSHGE